MKFAPKDKLLVFFALVFSGSLFAAPNPPEPIPPVPPGLPIDSGLILCLLLSIGFAYYKLHSNKKTSV